MYNNLSAPGAAGIAYGGMVLSPESAAFWMFLATFAIIAAALAVTRIIPRFAHCDGKVRLLGQRPAAWRKGEPPL